MGPETITLVCGLGSAVAWGAGDFSGGFAAKKGGVFMVMMPSQVVCGICYALAALAWNQPFPPLDQLALGCLAGMGGGFGMAALLRGLSTGRMGVVAPVSGVVGAAVPMVVAFFVMGFPGVLKAVGFLVAFLAVWRISSPGSRLGASKEEIWMAVLAGLGFGLFFVIIGLISRHAIFLAPGGFQNPAGVPGGFHGGEAGNL